MMPSTKSSSRCLRSSSAIVLASVASFVCCVVHSRASSVRHVHCGTASLLLGLDMEPCEPATLSSTKSQEAGLDSFDGLQGSLSNLFYRVGDIARLCGDHSLRHPDPQSSVAHIAFPDENKKPFGGILSHFREQSVLIIQRVPSKVRTQATRSRFYRFGKKTAALVQKWASTRFLRVVFAHLRTRKAFSFLRRVSILQSSDLLQHAIISPCSGGFQVQTQYSHLSSRIRAAPLNMRL